MNELSSNIQIEREIGERLRNHRLDRNISQKETAERSGLSRRTITAIENGEGCTLTSLIALLRGLDSLHTLDSFLPDPGISPMTMITSLREEPRKYASKPRKTPPPTEWKWADER